MNIIQGLIDGKMFQSELSGNVYKYEREQLFSKTKNESFKKSSLPASIFLQLIEDNELKPYEPKQNYKNDIVEFTVKETDDNYEIQFQKFPNELRGVDELGEIGIMTVASIGSPLYDFEENLDYSLYLPGKSETYDNNISKIPKSHVSKDFFQKLFNLITEKAEGKIEDSNIFFSEEYARKFRNFSEEQLELMVDLFRDAIKNIK